MRRASLSNDDNLPDYSGSTPVGVRAGPEESTFLAVRLDEMREFIEKVQRRAYAAEEVVEVDELVRRMSVLVRKPESEQDSIDAKKFLELDDDGDRSAFALVERFFAEPLFER